MPGGGGPSDGGGAPEDVCTGDPNVDELSLNVDDAAALPGLPARVVQTTEHFAVCGDGWVQLYDPATRRTGPAFDLAGPCRGVAKAGHQRIVVVSDTALSLLAIDGDTLHGVATTALAGGIGGVAADAEQAWVAAGTAGVLAFSISGDALTSTGIWPVADARDVGLTEIGVAVAAGSAGVALFDLSGASLGTAATDSPALGVRTSDRRVAVLRGAFGWDLFEASGLTHLASLDTGGVVVDAAVADAEVLTAEGHALIRYEALDDEVEVAAVQPRPNAGALDAPWIRGVARGEVGAVVVDDVSIAELTIDTMAAGPRLEVDVPSISLWSDEAGVTEGLYVLRNAGDADLHLRSVSADGPVTATVEGTQLAESDACPGQLVVEPGSSVPVTLSYAPTGAPFTATLTIETDDPDALELKIPIDGDRPSPTSGELVDDFVVPTLEGGAFRLSDHLGKVVFIKLFNFACSTCAEEFPLIESELRPLWTTDDVVMLGLNTAHRTAYAAGLAADSDLSFDVGLDLDSEVFRRLRIPGAVFPLHVVIDRDGRLAWVSNEKGIEPIRAAIEASR